MPLYTKNDIGLKQPLSLDQYKPSLGESMSAAWDAAMSMNPVQSMENLTLTAINGGDFADMSESDIIDFARDEIANATPGMSLEAQKQRIADNGLEGR